MPRRLRGRPLPPVVAVTVSAHTIGLLLAAPRPDPAMGFESIDDGMTWVIERPMLAPVAAPPTRRTPWPLLAPLGHVQPHGSLVLANLEHFGAVDLIGEPQDVEALAGFLGAGIAADHLGARPLMICVNCNRHLAGVSGVRVAESVGDVLDDVRRHRARLVASAARPRDLRAQRVHRARRTAPPLVVIDPHTRDREMHNRLHALAGPALAVVTAGTGGGRWRSREPATPGWALEVNGCDIRWHPVGVDLRFGGRGRRPVPDPDAKIPRRHMAPAVMATGIGNCRNEVAVRSGGPARAATSVARRDAHGSVAEFAETGRRSDAPGTAPGPVELQVLGIVQVIGAAVPFTSQRALDLACFLAVNRDGANADRLCDLLWQRSEPPPSRKTFGNVVSRARVCLGHDTNGRPLLPRVGADGVYRLSPQVTTDLERFVAWRRAAERVSPPQAIEYLVAAVSMVRGASFGGGSGGTFSWADVSWRSHVEHLVDNTFHWLADEALDLGRLDLARWVTLRGLSITPDCEHCCEQRMIAARRSGDRREISAAMRHMRRLEAELALPPDELAGIGLDGMHT